MRSRPVERRTTTERRPGAELIRKLSGKTANSPFLTQIGWGTATRGSVFGLRFVIAIN